jgi:hypothetical protein
MQIRQIFDWQYDRGNFYILESSSCRASLNEVKLLRVHAKEVKDSEANGILYDVNFALCEQVDGVVLS